MNQIDKDFVYNRYPKTEHDIQLLETYKQDLLSENVSYDSLRPLSEDTFLSMRELWGQKKITQS